MPTLLLFCVIFQSSYNVAMVVEVPFVAALPNSVVHSRMLKPFRYQTAGTIMAGKLARDRGWAINIGESSSPLAYLWSSGSRAWWWAF